MQSSIQTPEQFEIAQAIPTLRVLQSSGLSDDVDLSVALFDGSFEHGPMEESRDHVITTHLGGAPVFVQENSASEEQQVNSGCITISPATSIGSARTSGDVRFLHMYVGSNFVNKLGEELGYSQSRDIDLHVVGSTPSQFIHSIAEHLAHLLMTQQISNSLELSAYAQVVGIELLREFSHVGARAKFDKPQGLSMSRLNTTIEFIESHLDQNVTLKSLANLANLSPYHFSRSFKDATGLSPHAFLLSRRVSYARRMLEDPKEPIAVVAIASGFSSQQHFTTAFRKHTGMTPGAYRKAIIS